MIKSNIDLLKFEFLEQNVINVFSVVSVTCINQI